MDIVPYAERLMNSIESLLESFSEVEDPRVERTRVHQLGDILVLAILAVMAGAEGWEDIEEFGKQKQPWLSKYLKLPHGIPSHDTIRRVFIKVKPSGFQDAFLKWANQLSSTTSKFRTIAIDGKSIRRSHDRKSMKSMLHSVSAWCCQNQLMIGQHAVDAKSNEITAIPELLEQIELEGAIITTDAMGCQVEIASKICQEKGHYMLAVKDNQPSLAENLAHEFTQLHDGESEVSARRHHTTDRGHGRIEKRTYFQIPLSEKFRKRHSRWTNLTTAVQAINVTERDGKETEEVRYYISDLPMGVKRAAKAIRNHWGIENSLHWVLDVTFNEDQSRIRKEQGTENFALLRRFAINLIRQDTSKGSIAKKRKRAAWNNEFLFSLANNTN